MRKRFSLISLAFIPLLGACAGPYHPFGAQNVTDQVTKSLQAAQTFEDAPKSSRAPTSLGSEDSKGSVKKVTAKIDIYPGTQDLKSHDAFQVLIQDENLPSQEDLLEKRLKIHYNSEDVTLEALRHSHFQRLSKSKTLITFPHFRSNSLNNKTEIKHRVGINYTTEEGDKLHQIFNGPQCLKNHQETKDFHITPVARKQLHSMGLSPQEQDRVENISQRHQMNPYFLSTYLVSQKGNKSIDESLKTFFKKQNFWKETRNKILLKSVYPKGNIPEDVRWATLYQKPKEIKKAILLKGKNWKRSSLVKNLSKIHRLKSTCFSLSNIKDRDKKNHLLAKSQEIK